MFSKRPVLVEIVTAAVLVAVPFVLPHLDAAPNTVNRVLVWGLFGIGFDILFGYTGLLSFGQSAFYGTGGFVAAYLLTRAGFPNVVLALLIGMAAAAVVGWLIGVLALRRTGIYFAMITVAIAEIFFFVEFNPLADWTGGENGLPGVPTPSFDLGFVKLDFTSGWSLYPFLAFCYFVGIVIALRIVRSPVGAILTAIRENPLRAAAVGHRVQAYKLTAFVIAAAYAGFAGGLLGVLQGFMPPDAFMFDTSGQLIMQTAIGGRGTLFGPLVGAGVWLFLQDFLQATLKLGAAWKLVLGLVFVLLVCFLRQGIIGGIRDLVAIAGGKGKASAEPAQDAAAPSAGLPVAPMAARRVVASDFHGPLLQVKSLTKRYGGVVANEGIDFAVAPGELRGIIGPNGAGKTTFFKMLTCEVPPTSGTILFEGRDITGMGITDVCQLGLTKSYQVNQLFNKLTVRENVTIAALAELRGRFRLDLFGRLSKIRGLDEQVEHTLQLVNLTARRDTPVAQLAYGEKRRLEIGLALASSPSLLLLDEPLAGMSPRERVETVRLLKSIAQGRTMIVIDHDMDALFELAGRITVLQEGRVLVEGSPDEIKGNALVQEAYLGGVQEEALVP
ncbi:MAG TPA: branched-chain amino acid ABC transporter ATP-binding protein/permease [Caldimonas sp.]|nr:branched-chain amino acid ABC transporter ATP-binding protein/permease [Caldimonas sp.]